MFLAPAADPDDDLFDAKSDDIFTEGKNLFAEESAYWKTKTPGGSGNEDILPPSLPDLPALKPGNLGFDCNLYVSNWKKIFCDITFITIQIIAWKDSFVLFSKIVFYLLYTQFCKRKKLVSRSPGIVQKFPKKQN